MSFAIPVLPRPTLLRTPRKTGSNGPSLACRLQALRDLYGRVAMLGGHR